VVPTVRVHAVPDLLEFVLDLARRLKLERRDAVSSLKLSRPQKIRLNLQVRKLSPWLLVLSLALRLLVVRLLILLERRMLVMVKVCSLLVDSA
jgi:hypothetical protein